MLNYEEMQRQTQALGRAWYIDSGSPGGDHVAWLDLVDGTRLGMSPQEHDKLGGLRWYVARETDQGPTHIEHVLLTSEAPATVAARVKALMEVWELKPAVECNEGATKVGMAPGCDYLETFTFNKDFPIPTAYVVAYGMAHFRGPDGFLWFCPDTGKSGEIEWGVPQNVAEFDERNADEETDPNRHGPAYQMVMARICRLVDEALAADADYKALSAAPANANPLMFSR